MKTLFILALILIGCASAEEVPSPQLASVCSQDQVCGWECGPFEHDMKLRFDGNVVTVMVLPLGHLPILPAGETTRIYSCADEVHSLELIRF